MTSTESPISPPNGGNTPEQAQRRARFQQLKVRLRAQRKRMDQLAAAEFIEVVESIAYRLKCDQQADLVAYHIREVWQRFALSLPHNWQHNMAAYVRKDVQRDPWFRAPMNEQCPMTPDRLRTFAQLLVASHRRTKATKLTAEVAHG